MEPTEKDIALIEQYLEGKLSTEEKADFEKRLETDAELAALFELQQTVIEGIQEQDAPISFNKMDSWHDEMQQEASKPKVVKMRSSRLRYWAAAACIVLVAGLSYLFLLSGGNTSAEELYADNFKPYQDLITMRDGSADAQIATAMETYRAGNFEDAVPLFDALMDRGHETAGLLLYSGIAHIAQPTPQTEEGIGHFEWIIANYKDSEYYFAAEWYLGLAYLQLPDSEKAKKQFEKISLLGNSYSAKADEILENL